MAFILIFWRYWISCNTHWLIFLFQKKAKTHEIKGNRYEKKYIIIKNIEELRVSENEVIVVMEWEGEN